MVNMDADGGDAPGTGAVKVGTGENGSEAPFLTRVIVYHSKSHPVGVPYVVPNPPYITPTG